METRKISKEDRILHNTLQKKITEFFQIYGSSERIPKGGRYQNFRVIYYFKNGSTSVRFMTKEKAMEISRNFVANNILGGKVRRLVINLKFRPDVKICDLDIVKICEQSKIEAARIYGIFN